MRLAEAFAHVAAEPLARRVERLSATLNLDWIHQALAATGSASVRRRKLPAEAVVWLVIGMALVRDRSIDEVVRHIDLVLPGADADRAVSHAAIVQARDRLGVEPLAVLFGSTAQHWATPAAEAQRWRGLAVYGVDGTTLRLADTADNERVFGRPKNGRSVGAYPQLRLLALMVLRSRLLAALVPGSYGSSEHTLARPLWEQLPERSVVVLDKGLINYAVFHSIQRRGGRHWLCRASAALKWTVVRSLGPSDDLVEITVRSALRKADPQLPPTLLMRAIRYQRPGFRPGVLLTSLLDPQAFPAAELCALYHERWELELGFAEVKTHTLDRQETLRSKAPQRVLQELWGLAIAYNLVRYEMLRVAEHLQLPPRRISFRHTLMLIRNFLVSAWFASPGVLPKRWETLHRDIALLVLPERRSRTYKREVKIQASSFPKKPPPKRDPFPRWLK